MEEWGNGGMEEWRNVMSFMQPPPNRKYLVYTEGNIPIKCTAELQVSNYILCMCMYVYVVSM